MYRRVSLLVLLALLAGMVPAALAQQPVGTGVAPQQGPPTPVASTGANNEAPTGGVENVTGSTVNYISPSMLPPGSAFDLCFNVSETSNDAEYLDGFDADLPDGWTVNYVIDVPATSTCGNGHTYGVNAGNVLYWYTNGMPSGCGDWLPGTYDFCANITVPDCSGSPWSLAWNIWGDTWGSPPHSVSGATTAECLQPGVYLMPATREGGGCNGVPATYQFSLVNQTGSDGTFDLTYSVPSANGTLTGPAQFTVPNGGTQDFEVELTPGLCTPEGDEVIGLLEATGNGYTDQSVITHTISLLPYWQAVPASAPAWAGSGYPRDGCTAMNGAGDWVTYIIGDMASFAGFWGYNHTTNTWAQPGAANTPADRWAPDWAYDPDTNLCYLTGGANTPGGGTYNEAYRFDPVANAFTALGSFTSIRDFHNSWVGTIDGVKYLCIGGGVNSGSVMVQATQCYDLSQPAPGAWNAENAQMAAYPTDAFGAADGILHAPTGDQFWYVGGAINNGGTVTDEARYWDDADNAWHLAGNTGVPRYRVEGDFLNGDFYQAGGSSGGFTPTTDTVRGHFDGTNWGWTLLGNMHNARMDNVLNAAGGTLWSVDGYGAASPDYVEYLAFCPECGGFQAWKDAPAQAMSGDVMTYDITIQAPMLMPGMYMSDTLPAGVAYAGNLTYTAGYAWYDGVNNAVYWTVPPLRAAAAPVERPTVYRPGAEADLVGAAEVPAPAVPAPAVPAGPTWDYPDAVLWDNGPLVTYPGDCSGADASRLQNVTLLMNTYGFGNQYLNNNHMADDFEITDPGGWQIDQVTFFAYQSGSPTNPSPITGVYYQIWDGPPDDPGSSIVFGDLSTNRLLSSAWTNIYRDYETTTCGTTRPIMADVASAGVMLPPGTYWLEWVTDGSTSYTGPWAPPITILGQTTTGNALQYLGSTSVWQAALDTGTSTQQGMPFIIEGSIIGGGVQVNISFDVTVTAYCGETIRNEGVAGDGVTVVDFSAATGVLGEPEIEVTPMSLWAELCPDATTTQTLQICNLGTCELTWDIHETTPTLALAPAPVVPRVPYAGRPVVLSSSSPEGVSVETNPPIIDAPVILVLDDGSRENDIGLGGTIEMLWVNRFTPNPDEFPFTLDRIEVYFSAVGLVNVGDDIVLIVYENTTGNNDPAVGSNWLASFPTTVQALDTWSVYPLATPVVLNGPGDVIVGVIGMETPGTDYYPASMDQTTSQQRSWAGWWNSSPPPTPPLLPPDNWTLIDNYFPGNWMVRGYGETIAPVDFPWVSESPISGTVPPGECQDVAVTFDATGLAPGDYFVDLVIHSNDPDEPEVVVPVTMTVDTPVEIVDVTYFTADLMVTFTAQVTGSEPIYYLWDFDDGSTSTETNPVHTYAAGGCYSVSLDIANACGLDSWIGQVCVCDPVHDADFTWMPVTPMVDEVVYFTATAAGTGPFTYDWDLGDGTTASGQYVNHAYTAIGVYTVVMTATGQCGFQVVTHDVTVASGCVAPAGADFTWTPITPTAGANVDFSGSVLTGTSPLTFDWQFSDGGTASGQNVTHVFASPGTYVVTMTVANGCGNDQMVHQVVVIGTCEPVTNAAFTWLPPSPQVGEDVTFNATAEGSPVIAFAWAFGDGATGSGAAVTHAYAAEGDYEVTLTATNGCGEQVVLHTVTVVTGCVAPAGANFTWLPLNPTVGQVVSFNGTLGAGTTPLYYTWTFGDSGSASGTLTPSHTYGSAGTFTVTLTVTNTCGTVTATHPITVQAVVTVYKIYLPIIYRP